MFQVFSWIHRDFFLFFPSGPAIIAQRLMFAAAAAAAAIPKEISSPENSSLDETAEKCRDEMLSQEITDESTPVEAEAVAQAFLKSVDKYFEVNENNDDKKFGTGTTSSSFAKDELSDIIGKNEFKVGCYRTQHFSVVVVHTRTLPFIPHPHCNRTRTRTQTL